MSQSARPTRWLSCLRGGPAGVLAALVIAAAVVVGSGVPRSEQAAAEQAPRGETEANGAADLDQDAPARPATPRRQGTRRNVDYPFPQRVRVPADIFDGGTGWLNTSGPIELKDLRGKIVLLDFWTYCCINCLHVLPDLKYLEHKYPDELVVIGVHSGKFDNEKDPENIRQAILRHEIEHPVVNDSEMRIWQRIGVRAWPSFLLIDAEGHACQMLSGEGHRDLLDTLIARLIRYHDATGTLDRTPVRFDLEREKAEPTPLRFPGKLLADPDGDRLFISDSNHNRIVITTLDGQLLDVVGTGAMGAQDGPFDEATFDHPQGMTLVGNVLYVADTENHLLRSVDLQARTVSTLAGTGRQGRWGQTGGALRRTHLNSPWDVLHVNRVLYVAMAGPHQIWSHRLGSAQIGVYAGSGREDILDGPLKDAALAQPSGLATDGEFLYVCDSEGSAIRRVELRANGQVTTVVGPSNLPQGRSLFEFGDIDGVGGNARLQHVLGIACDGKRLYIADTYNHKIKIIDLDQSAVRSWLGTGRPGDGIDPPEFFEPSGLALAGDRLYIADTNNHRILVADRNSGVVAPLSIEGLAPPEVEEAPTRDPADDAPPAETALQRVAPGEALRFEIALELPEDYKLNPLGPLSWRLQADEGQELVAADLLGVRRSDATGEGTMVTIDVPLAAAAGKATLDLALTYGYCRDGVGGLCKVQTARWTIPVEIAEGAPETSITLEAAAE